MFLRLGVQGSAKQQLPSAMFKAGQAMMFNRKIRGKGGMKLVSKIKSAWSRCR
jgi:hypothetical protein